jgi:phosphate-selective porin OprO/OprP
LQPRYEQEVVHGGAGDQYQAVYGGVNYLLYGDRLELMTGVEYSAMHDSARDGGEFNGWTCFASVRVFF